MSITYINSALPSMIRGLYKADLREKSIQGMLDLAADLVQDLIDLREQADREPSDAEVLAALNASDLSVRERSGTARHFNPAPDLTYYDEGNFADMRAALLAAQGVQRG